MAVACNWAVLASLCCLHSPTRHLPCVSVCVFRGFAQQTVDSGCGEVKRAAGRGGMHAEVHEGTVGGDMREARRIRRMRIDGSGRP